MTAKRISSATRLLIKGLLVASLMGLSSAFADTLNIKGDAPQSYTVVKGDTLWDISGRYLDQPWRWPELWENNPQIANPHLIYPGDVISLQDCNGKPCLAINRATANLKLSPKVRATRIDDAIPVVPVDALRPLMKKLDILDKATMDKAPYVIQGQEGRLMLSQGDRVYVKNLDGKADTYQVYHLGDPINDPATGKPIAYEGYIVGNASMDAGGDPATVLMTSAKREVTVGDRLLPAKKDKILSDVYPTVPDKKLDGQILTVLDGTDIIGRYQTVVVNLGKQHGLNNGHVLSVFNKGEIVDDVVSPERGDKVTLPDERSGTLLIVDAYEQLSYALVMESRLPIKVLDQVRTPE